MAVKMYRGKNSMMVRGMNVTARLNEGWTFEPSETKITLKPRRTRRTKRTEVIEPTTDPTGPTDLNNEETTNGY